MGFRRFRTTLISLAVSGGQTKAGVSAISASDMPIARRSVGRPLPGFCDSRNLRKRDANARWIGVAGPGERIAQARIGANRNSFAPPIGPEIGVRRARAQSYRAMALREITEASEHGADPVEGLRHP